MAVEIISNSVVKMMIVQSAVMESGLVLCFIHVLVQNKVSPQALKLGDCLPGKDENEPERQSDSNGSDEKKPRIVPIGRETDILGKGRNSLIIV